MLPIWASDCTRVLMVDCSLSADNTKDASYFHPNGTSTRECAKIAFIESTVAEGINMGFALRSISNRSHAMSNRVSDIRTRILKTADQRPAQKIGQLRPAIHKITQQRLRFISLTLGNVALIPANQTRSIETGLPG